MTQRLSGASDDGAAALWLGTVARIVAFAGLALIILIALAAAATALVPGGGGILGAGLSMSAAALLAGAVLIRFADGRAPAALGIGLSRSTLPHIAWGLGIGVAALTVAALAMIATGSLRYVAAPGTATEWAAAVALQAAIFTAAAFAEEALFRGYPFQVLVRAAGPAVATVAGAALFALAHARNPEVGPFALLNIFLAGVLLAVAYLRTLSLWFATALHMGWNWAMATLFDLPVSGLQVFDTPGYDPVLAGPVAWSGGPFGPEGGMTGTLGFAFALLVLLRLRRLRPDPRIAAAAPLVLQWRGTVHDG